VATGVSGVVVHTRGDRRRTILPIANSEVDVEELRIEILYSKIDEE
jgi:hypothetical protein